MRNGSADHETFRMLHEITPGNVTDPEEEKGPDVSLPFFYRKKQNDTSGAFLTSMA